jgi:hypothetical protein
MGVTGIRGKGVRDMVPPAHGACTHARRWYPIGSVRAQAIFLLMDEKIASLSLYRLRTTDVQEYLHHGPEAPCYDRTRQSPLDAAVHLPDPYQT